MKKRLELDIQTMKKGFSDQWNWRALVRKLFLKLMWKPYLKVIRRKVPQALHRLDRFHIVVLLNKAVDEVRRQETQRLKRDGYEELLTHSRYCFLKNESNLTDRQALKLEELLQYDLKSVRAYLLKESFQGFWQYSSPYSGRCVPNWNR